MMAQILREHAQYNWCDRMAISEMAMTQMANGNGHTLSAIRESAHYYEAYFQYEEPLPL